MADIKKVSIGEILDSQIPEFLNEDSPLFKEFLSEYYKSLEIKSGAIDLAKNIKEYKDIDAYNTENLVGSVYPQLFYLTSDVLSFDDVIYVTSTYGWPNTYGLLKINDEIITYTGITTNSFTGCIRGFSGIDQIKSFANSEFLNFSSTIAEEHSAGTIVYNLSTLFIQEFFKKFKSEFLPGFESRTFVSGLSTKNILSRAKDFYITKGTDVSYKLLFKILYGTNIKVIKPKDYTIVPSANSYFTTKNILVEKLSGNDPTLTKGNFLYQELSGIGTVSASIYNVEYRPVSNKELYEVSLDSTSFNGTFQVTGKTKILESTLTGSNTLLVDSTVGFSKSGKVLVKPKNSNYIELTYTDKTSNQFLGVSGITKDLDYGLDIVEEKFAYAYIGIGNTSKVEFRIVNVIDSVNFDNTFNMKVGDTVKLSGFGKDLSSDFQFNSWIYNLPTKHIIKDISQQDVNKFRVVLYDGVSFYKNEVLNLVDTYGNTIKALVVVIEFPSGDVVKKYSSQILVQVLSTNFNPLNAKYISKIIYKANHQQSSYYPNLSAIPSGVQNTYLDFDDNNFYVTSTGTPNYTIFAGDTKTYCSVVGTSSTSKLNATNHSFTTGEVVYYSPGISSTSNSGVTTGYYFVNKIDSNNLSLCFSKTDLLAQKFILFNPGIRTDYIVKSGYENKTILNQKLLKKFPRGKQKNYRFDDKNKRTTNNRPIGLLANGVELLSPTLFDENIFYGKISSIEVTNPGEGYDVVNPAPIVINDISGSGAKAHINLKGVVTNIKVITPGIGYQTKPKITITGGNGTGCVLDCNLVKSRITAGFKPEVGVDIVNNIITFAQNHNFDDTEEVIYLSNGNSNVTGLVDQSHYFVGIVTSGSVKLYNNQIDASNKTNEIDITGISSGFHNIQTLKSKNTITQVYVKDPGSGYSNRKVKIPSVLSPKNSAGISTYDSYLYAPNHGFNSGELVVYSCTDTPIAGLSTLNSYYVTTIDSNKFRLSLAGVGTNLTRDNYFKKKFIQYTDAGIGTHIIGYPPIVVSVEALSAIGSTSIVQPYLEPIVIGSVSDVYLEDGGISYGSTNIINYHRRPNIGIASITSTCILKPIIINGSIVDIKIINKGLGYRIDSDIIVSGSGYYAEIDPIVSNSSVVGFRIRSGGVGYASSNTVLTVVNRGKNVQFLGNINQWKINQVVKSSGLISYDDDGILYPSKNNTLGLQFVSFYPPKKLRYQLDDNINENYIESASSKQHSPIIGFAYDGNPIYGPYGYDPLTGGYIRQMQSSYALNVERTFGVRPPGFVDGYFSNDYVFTNSGDLDEYNGRYCLTPQYPNGTYAYFASFSINSSGQAIPSYPYITGEYFKDSPIVEDFLPSFNQDIDLTSLSITRNVGPYYLNYSNSYYDLIDKISDDFKQEFRVSDVKSAGITSTSIFSAGIDYQVNDRLIVNSDDDSGSGTNIVVSKVDGKSISNFSVSQVKISGVEFNIKSKFVLCKTGDPHSLVDGETIIVSGVSTITSSGIEGARKISVFNKTVELMNDIPNYAITGISTFITVKDISGFLVNDLIGIGTETLRITNISPQKSRFYVNRTANAGVHTAGIDKVSLIPTAFSFALDQANPDNTFDNYVTFFDPKETVGTGTAGVTRYLVGIGTSSIESRYLPTRSIYIPNHKFYTGQPLIYNAGVGGTSLSVNNVGSGVSFNINSNQIVYAVNLGTDYLGISTVGFTSITGIGTNLNSLEFQDITGAFNYIGFAHSLSTINPKITGTIERFSGIVTTSQNHNLQTGDNIDFTISPRQTDIVVLSYNSSIRKVVSNKVIFSSSSVSTTDSTITITDTTFKTGDKVVYSSSNPISGLSNNGIYYVLKTDINKIQLCKYRSDISISNIIVFTGTGSAIQSLSLINPPLVFIKGNVIKFDVSDPTLTNMRLEFYQDINFQRKLETLGTVSEGFVVTRSGTFDSGTSGAYVIVDTNNKYCPSSFYYNLVSVSLSDETKNQISSDDDVVSNNQVTIKQHLLNDSYNVSVYSDVGFVFNLKSKPTIIEQLSYNSGDLVSYKTSSPTAYGPIVDLKINFGGRGYKKLPYVERVQSNLGQNAIIKLISNDIGKVSSSERIKDGFDYPTDSTLTPSLSIPTVIGIKDVRTIDYVGIVTGGKRYNTAPTLYVKDNANIKLSAQISGGSVSSVKVISNVINLKEPLSIYSLYNSNGYDIDNIVVLGNTITLELLNTSSFINSGYGNTSIIYPFSVGDQIFIENCRLTADTSSRANFNSSSYNYQFFTVTNVDKNNNTVTYSMSGISTGLFGTYDDTLTLGYVVNKKDMPVFNMILADNAQYLSGERVIAPTFSATVMENGWDNNINQLRVNNSLGSLNINDKLTGERSKIIGTVEYFNTFLLNSTLGVSRDKVGVIDNSVGILNDYQQRISDNFYYQKFSYSIKGQIPYDVWRESVKSIVHPSGFKEFSDLEIITKATGNEVSIGIAKSTNLKPGISTSDSTILVEVDNVISVNQKNNFAMVYEEDSINPGVVERVYFDEGIALRKYIVNKTNKVIKIDDISDQFNGTSTQSLVGRYVDASNLLALNKNFIQEEVVGFITATYPGISTNPDWDRSICRRDVGYIVDALAHDIQYQSNDKSIQAGLAYWSGIGTNYVAGETVETIGAFQYISNLSKFIINNVGINTSYQLSTSVAITSAVYNNSTGITTLRTTYPHGISTTGTSYIVLKNLVFSCNSGGGLSTAIFPNLGPGPDGKGVLSPKGFVYQANVIDSTTFTVNVGVSTIVHNYVNGGTVQNAFISTSQYIDTRVLPDTSCSSTYSQNCCANVQSSIVSLVGIITSIIGIGTTSAPSIIYPSLTAGGSVVGISSFVLKNNGVPLFKHSFVSSSSTCVSLENNSFIIPYHNYQTGQELSYDYGSGSPVGIATTSYVTGTKDIVMNIANLTVNGSAILENGYGQALTTSITGLSTVLVPSGPTSKLYFGVVGIATTGTGTGATFNVLITYNGSNGQPISTSLSLVSGGSGYVVGDKVSIAGTYFGGTNPTNTLSFYVSKTGPTGIQTQANVTYSSVPSTATSGSGAIFNVTRANDGTISSVNVVNGGSGYTSTSLISIAGTYIGGSSSKDNITFNPAELGTNKLPSTVFVYKIDDLNFKVSGLSTSLFLDITNYGIGTHSFSYKNPNASTLISVDGIIQTALRRNILNLNLGSSVATASTTYVQISSGISSVKTGNILNIDSEYLLVSNIGNAGANTLTVQRGYLGTQAGVHTVGAAITVLTGDYNIVGDTIYFVTPPYGKIGPVGLLTGSVFGGRVFSRQFDPTQSKDKNIILDDISLSFTGVGATQFALFSNQQTTTTVYNNVNNSSFINNNPIVLINNVFQDPTYDYTIDGQTQNTIKFLSGVPKAGRISKVSIGTGFGYQPLIGAAATVTVSAAGTITSVNIIGSGSGYRSSPSISIASTIGSGAIISGTIGTGGTITSFIVVNGGVGYSQTSLPTVVIGIPTGYSNIGVAYSTIGSSLYLNYDFSLTSYKFDSNLITLDNLSTSYATGGTIGVGQGAKVSVSVGQGSSIISFKIDNPGYGYKPGEVLFVPGITTNPTVGPLFSAFTITVQEVETDKFTGFYPGQFIRFDDVSSQFNGFRKKFTLTVTQNNITQPLSLKTLKGSDLDITNNIFIYINDILQIPGESYTFAGSRVSFTEAPKPNSKCTILYYRGSSIDVEDVDPPKTFKEGDTLIIKENKNNILDADQLPRVVKKIVSSDQLDTFTYNSVGVLTDPTKFRPVTWIKQRNDTIINGTLYSKARPSLTSLIRPNAIVIKPISQTDESIYVNNAFPIFSNVDGLSEDLRNILITETRTPSPAISTSIVGSSSSVSSISLISGGVGYAYTQNPEITISKSAIQKKDPIKNWTSTSGLSSTYYLNSLTYGNIFVSVGNSSVYAYSGDGSVWSSGLVGFAGTIGFNQVSCGGTNIYFAAGDYGTVVKSVGYGNTITSWSKLSLLQEIVVQGIGVVARVGASYTGSFRSVVYSPYFDTWTAVGVATATPTLFGGVGIGTTTLTQRYSDTLSNLNSVVAGPTQIVAVGDNGTIVRSVNNIVWESITSPTNQNLNKVIYVNGSFIAVGNNGAVIKSTNSVFQYIYTNVTENIVDIFYNDFYVILTSTGKLYYSFNLTTWVLRSTNQSNILRSIRFVSSVGLEGRYVSVGFGGTAIYSDPVYNRATAVSNVTAGVVTSITITEGGFGYSSSNPPSVMIAPDKNKTELIKSIKAVGDYGNIIGINTFIAGTPGIGTTSPKIEFILQSEYSTLSQYGVLYSQLSKGDYFIISNSNVVVGQALTGITTTLGGMTNYPNSRVGTAYSFLDGVYMVEYVTSPVIVGPNSGGICTVTCNFAPIEGPLGNYVQVYTRGPNNTGVNTNGSSGTTPFYGRYSWGKVYDYQNRILGNPKSFDVYNNNGLSGISTNPQIFRTVGL